MKVKPISPNEIIYDIPDFVIEAVNNLLKKKYRGDSDFDSYYTFTSIKK